MEQMCQISGELDDLDNAIALLSEWRARLALQRYALYLLEVFRAVPELETLELTGCRMYKYDAFGRYCGPLRLRVRPVFSSRPERIVLFGANSEIDRAFDVEDAAIALSQLLDRSPLAERISDVGPERRTYIRVRTLGARAVSRFQNIGCAGARESVLSDGHASNQSRREAILSSAEWTPMKKFRLVFGCEVRKSLAAELKKASLFGGITAAALGLKEGSGLWLLIAALSSWRYRPWRTWFWHLTRKSGIKGPIVQTQTPSSSRRQRC